MAYVDLDVDTKTNVGTRVAIGIVVSAILVAGGGIFAELSGAFAPRLSPSIQPSGGSPGAFSLLSPASPANGAIDQDDSVTLTWERSIEGASIDKPAQADPNWNFIKSAKATHQSMRYEVHIGPSFPAGSVVKVVTITSLSYTATNLLPGTEYTWKIVADSGHAKKTSRDTWTFTTAGESWIQSLALSYPVCPNNPAPFCINSSLESDICGANYKDDGDGIITCVEFIDIWFYCSGTTNRCPENLEINYCMQNSICYSDSITVGDNFTNCDEYIAAFNNPCSI